MPEFSRILLKLSGEILREGEVAFAAERIRPIAEAIATVRAEGVQVGVVVGGGNLFRGREIPEEMSRAEADQVGMLATILNAAMLRFHLLASGTPARVFAPRAVPPVAEFFDRARALAAMEDGEVLIFGGGTGNPYFSTDSAAALRAIELEADILLKGTKVDGVYDEDPIAHPDARRFETLSFDEVIRRDLKVMDQTAIALCRDQGMQIMVFGFTEPENLVSVVRGTLRGTVIG